VRKGSSLCQQGLWELQLDWHIGGDNGERATNIIRAILDADAQDARLRLIAIYTGDWRLAELVDELAKRLDGDFAVDQERCLLTRDRVRIVMLAKNGTSVLAPQGLVVSEADLAKRVIAEFSEHADGLLSNLVLAYLASIRANTHVLISRFDRRLDAAYLADRTAQPIPDDAVDFAMTLVAQAVAVSVDAVKLKDYVSLATLKLWIARERGLGRPFIMRGWKGRAAVSLKDGDLAGLLEKGREAGRPSSVARDRLREASAVTGLLCEDGADAEALDHEFAQLTCLARTHQTARPDGSPPRLRLGAVVCREGGGESGGDRYLLCVQPVCDSVRLTSARAFLFLPMAVVTGADRVFDLALPGINGERLAVRINMRPFEVVRLTFAPSAVVQCVVARPVGEEWAFVGHHRTRWMWIADLRDEQAQRIVHQYGGEISRVGVSESEWARAARRNRLA
jgi:hypothetical protein